MRTSRTTEESKFATRILRDLQKEGGLSSQAAARLGLTFLAVVKRNDWGRIRHAVEEDPHKVAEVLGSALYAAGMPFDLPVDSDPLSRMKQDAVRKIVSAFDRITPWQTESIQAVAEILALSAFKNPQTPPAVAGLVAEIARPPTGATLFDPALQAGMIALRTALRAEERPAGVYGWSSPDNPGDKDAWKVTWLVLRASGIEDVKIYPGPPQDVSHLASSPSTDIVATDLTRVSVSRLRDEREPIVQALLARLDGGNPLMLLVPSGMLGDAKIAGLRKSLMDSNLTAVIRLPVSLFPRALHDIDLIAVRGGRDPCPDREVLFVDVAAYLAAGAARSPNAETSRAIGEMYRAFPERSNWTGSEIARFARAVPFREVRENHETGPGSGLEVALYVSPVIEPIDLRAAFERLKEVRKERQGIEEELEKRIDAVLKTNRF